jgi:hypothetical protein
VVEKAHRNHLTWSSAVAAYNTQGRIPNWLVALRCMRLLGGAF